MCDLREPKDLTMKRTHWNRWPGVVSARALLFGLFFAAGSLLLMPLQPGLRADDAEPAMNERAKAALRAKDYPTAVAALPNPATQEDWYLRALARYHGQDYTGAAEDAAKAVDAADQGLAHKARFLQASALTAMKQHEAAAAIYDAEAARLLSSERKAGIAQVYIDIAEELSALPAPEALTAPQPDYGKAADFYLKALELEVESSLRMELEFRRARMLQLAGDPHQAAGMFRQLLENWDNAWRTRNGLEPVEAGLPTLPQERAMLVRFYLAQAMLDSGDPAGARNLTGEITGAAGGELAAAALLLNLRSYRFPQSESDNEWALGVRDARAFLERFPDHHKAVEVAFQIAQADVHLSQRTAGGRSDEAIADLQAFLAQTGFKPTDAVSERPASLLLAIDTPIDNPISSRQQFQDLAPIAQFMLGQTYRQTKQYPKAREAFSEYLRSFPNGPHWTQAQEGLLDIEFQRGLDQIEEKDYPGAVATWQAFLDAHPLDVRAPRIMYLFGRIPYQLALEADEKKADSAALYEEAIRKWEQLVSKYPDTEESSHAQFLIGTILETKLMRLKDALTAYRKLTWGQWADDAQAQIQELSKKRLELKSPRIYRADETPAVEIGARNIEKLKLKLYHLNLEEFFRKSHGVHDIDSLDLALIDPDKEWEVTLDGYSEYLPIQQTIPLPVEPGPGVWAVNVSEEDYQSTTLVIRSDLDIIVKASRKQVLVFAQNLTAQQPIEAAQILVSNGEKVFLEAETNSDGVLLQAAPELDSAGTLTIFAHADGHVASGTLDLQRLGKSAGLSPKGFIYTDRPVYLPGGKVGVKGILRSVKEGGYQVESETAYTLTIASPDGRIILSEEVELNEFGTFTAELALPADATEGSYEILVTAKDRPSHSGRFEVQRYQLSKVRLDLAFDRNYYFPGEPIKGTFTAETYDGRPLAESKLRYTLPDGRMLVAFTDANGVLEIEYPTHNYRPGQPLGFVGVLEDEGVSVQKVVSLPQFGFGIEITDVPNVCIAGEPLDASLMVKDPDGKPIEKSIEITLLHSQFRENSPILQDLPWSGPGNRDRGSYADVVVERKTITTSAAGPTAVRFIPELGGRYRIRAEAKDRLDQLVVQTASTFVSDDDDSVRLRMFADRTRVKVGDTVDIRTLWREAPALCLMTFEGEEVFDYELIKLASEAAPLKIQIGNEHYPNFTLALAAMQGTDLYQSSADFQVERELTVQIEPEQKAFEPGAVGKVRIRATDQQGNPVKAELSLALIQQALLDRWPDPLQRITEFFKEGARRDAALRTGASNGFEHYGTTREIPKELLAEEQRLSQMEAEALTRGEMASLDARLRANRQLGELSSLSMDAGQPIDGDMDMFFAGEPLYAPAPAAAPMGGMGGAMGYAGTANRPMAQTAAKRMAGRGVQLDVLSSEGIAFGAELAEAVTRQEIPGQGFWIGRVQTDADGRAEIEIPFPGETTKWVIKSRGATVETLVGEATGTVETRRELFVELQTPSSLVVGDSARIPLVAHNLADTAVEGILRLRILDGDQELKSFSSRVEIPARGRQRIVLDPFSAPDLRRVTLLAELVVNDQPVDRLERKLDIRPWGMPMTEYSAGSATDSRSLRLDRPGDATSPVRMNITIGDRVRSAIIEAALHSGPRPMQGLAIPRAGYERQANQLLACAAALGYVGRAKAEAAQVEALRATARGLVASLVNGQNEQGQWPRSPGLRRDDTAAGDIGVTARALWALAAARDQGIAVDDGVVERARTAIDQRFRAAQPAERDLKAMLLWSMARSGEADFAHANRLYRERGQLSAVGLAFTSLSLERLNRREMAGEVVDAILPLLPAPNVPGPIPFQRDSNYLWWSCSPAEVTALAALALEAARPEHDALPGLIQRLEGGRYGILPNAEGPTIAALAGYYAAAEYQSADFELAISVNGHAVQSLKITGTHPSSLIEVPAEYLTAGANRVDFEYSGRGSYAYAVAFTGWTETFSEARPWGKPYPTSRHIYHAPLRYKGRPMGSSTQEVKQIQVGEVVRVSVWIDRDGASNRPFILREPLPAGCELVPDSITARHDHIEMGNGEMLISFRPNQQLNSFSYELVGAVPGTYRIAPTQLTDAIDPSLVVCAKPSELEVLATGETPDYTYKMNCGELWAFAEAYFNDNVFDESLDYLNRLKQECPDSLVPNKERLLVWILSRPEFYDADALVDAFEVLKEKQPDLWVPFEKMQMVGRAYRDKGEHERAALVLRATIEASFYRDSRGGGTLESEGRHLASWEYMDRILTEYPDLNPVTDAEFGLTQLVYNQAGSPERLWDELRQLTDADVQLPNRITVLRWAVDRLRQFRCMHPESPLGDDAAFSEASALLDIGQHESMVALVRLAREIYPSDANFAPQFPYMEALGLFHQRAFDEAVKAAEEVAGSNNENRDLAVYILGQIYHAQSKPVEAVQYYTRVAEQYPDAAGALEYFKREELALPEITILKPGEAVELEVTSRNLKEARVLVYKVDLMTLYLREKNLARIAQVNLAGIDPQVGLDLALAEAVDYEQHKQNISLPLEEDGAFLVLVRSGDRFASGLVLITPLEIEVQEDTVSGTVRVNLRDESGYAEGVHVKAVGSAGTDVRSGDTDLRGVAVLDGIRGNVTIIARDKDRHYAFHRGSRWLGTDPTQPAEKQAELSSINGDAIDLASNLRKQVQMQMEYNVGQQQTLYHNEIKGVQVQAAF